MPKLLERCQLIEGNSPALKRLLLLPSNLLQPQLRFDVHQSVHRDISMNTANEMQL
jgi:hypothetical protein